MGFILGTTYEMYLWFDKKTKQGYFMSGHNVFFFGIKKELKFTLHLYKKSYLIMYL